VGGGDARGRAGDRERDERLHLLLERERERNGSKMLASRVPTQCPLSRWLKLGSKFVLVLN
jgi:hypothetical protein